MLKKWLNTVIILTMPNTIVRLESIEIKGLKNVSHGEISLFGSKQIRDALSEKVQICCPATLWEFLVKMDLEKQLS